MGMIKNINKKWIIIAILVLASFLRLWKLNTIPPHLTPDEAALGYNAYSILKTGRDEYGKFMPLVFKSFGDYKPGLYVYLTVPFVATLGLNEWSVRLASAIFGILCVYLIYLIVKKLFESHSKLPYIVALMAAISPWLIQVSRGAWEVNVSLGFTLLATYLFLSKKYVGSAVFFALTLLTYQGAKLSSLIVLGILFFIYKKEIKFKDLVKPAIIGFILSIPIFISFFKGETGRLGVFSIFSYKRPDEYVQQMLDQNNEKKGGSAYILYHNDFYDTIRGIMGRYFNHTSARFLFFEGDFANPRHSPPYQGMLLLSDMLFLVFGFAYLIKFYDKHKNAFNFVLLWLLLSPLPAVLSRDQVHAIRSLSMAIPLLIISSLGIYYAFSKFNKKLIQMALCLFIVVAFAYYLDSYFIHMPKRDSKLWEYGYKQIVETVAPIQNDYKAIKVQQSYAQPYIYFLFYTKYNPAKYQSEAKLKESSIGDVGQVEKLDNIYFSGIDWSQNRGEHGVLFVADPVRIPYEDSNDVNEFKLIKEIKYLDGTVAFRIIEVK